MASDGKIDWRGLGDGTPSSKPTTDARDGHETPMAKGNDWKGMEDGTPASKPNTDAGKA